MHLLILLFLVYMNYELSMCGVTELYKRTENVFAILDRVIFLTEYYIYRNPHQQNMG